METINNQTMEKSFELTPEEFETWEQLTKKAQLAYKHHTDCMSKLLEVAEPFAKTFEYLD